MISHDLIKKCLNGDRKAQYELYSYCYRLLMPIAVRYYFDRSEASSSINMCVVKILSKRKSWNDNVPFDLWARKILINLAIDDFRKRKRKELGESELPKLSPLAVENDALIKFNHEAILNVIQKLPEMHQKVFNLFTIDGYEHGEIAKMMGISENNSRYYLFDARKRLKSKVLSFELENKIYERR